MSGGDSGQASIEFVALAPLLLAVVLACAQLLAAGSARELAGHAAEAGAIALLQGADPKAAVTEALPGWSRARIRALVEGRRVRVRLRPRTIVPGMATMLEATAEANAGPQP